MATKKAAKSAKKAPQPVKKTPAKKAVVKPAPKAAKKAEPVKASHKKGLRLLPQLKAIMLNLLLPRPRHPLQHPRRLNPPLLFSPRPRLRVKKLPSLYLLWLNLEHLPRKRVPPHRPTM